MRVDSAIDVADIRRIAQKRLPRFVFDAIEGGAEDEITLRANRRGFERLTFRPRPFVDVSNRDLSTSVLGDRISMPLMLSPTGAGRMAHPTAELSVARAAGKARTVYMQSAVTSFRLEDVAASGTGSMWFQLYLPPTREQTEKIIDRVAKAGYRALAITVDSPVFGNRERDRRNGFSPPVRVSPRLVGQAMLRPLWAFDFLRGNISLTRRLDSAPRPLSLESTQDLILSSLWPVTWADLRFVRSLWRGPLLVKGIMRPDDCDQLVDSGVDGIIVSNHGGRQLDGAPATVEVLPSVVNAMRNRAEVFVDGGIRRGTDVVKAIALGAKACFVGRPYLYGLAAGGEAGVTRVLEVLRSEIDRSMALLGCSTIQDINSTLLGQDGHPLSE